MLDNFLVEERINSRFDTGGLDTLQHCLDQKHFNSYPYTVTYKYNSRGFRDIEWPDDVTNCIWAIGDSFTVGVGAPIEHSWPTVLAKKLNQPILNCGCDGASNDWISDRSKELLTSIQPKNLILQWTYIHRRQVGNQQLHFDKNTTEHDDIDNFCQNIIAVEQVKGLSNVIHSTIPYRYLKNPSIFNAVLKKKLPVDIKFTEPVTQIDFSRDGHHYNILTSQIYADRYAELIV